MTNKLKTLCRVTIAILTAPLWMPFYLYTVARLERDDIHN